MTDPAVPAETESGIPTDADLAFTPPEQDPYITRRDASGRFLKKTGEPPAEDPERTEEPEPAAAKPEDEAEAEKPEEERAPTAKEIANAKRYRKDLAKRERELNRLAEEVRSQGAEIERWRNLRRDNPRALLDELGVSFRELAEEAARQDGEDPRDKAIRELRQELEDLKGFKQSLSKEKETIAQQQAFNADVTAVSGRITEDADTYPFLADYGAEKAARAAVNAWYQRADSGAKPDLYDILDELETELRSDYERLTEARTKRNGGAGSSPAAQANGAPGRVNGAVKPAKHVADSNGTPPPATITNRNAAERASPDRALTREDRRRLAASRLVIRE